MATQKFLKNIRKGVSVEDLEKYVEKHPELLELIQAGDDELADLPLLAASESGHNDAIMWLIQCGAKTSSRTKPFKRTIPLRYKNNTDNPMLKRDCARLGENALLRACRMWQHDSVKVLLEFYDVENCLETCADRTVTVFGAVRRKTTRLLAESLELDDEKEKVAEKQSGKAETHDSWNEKFDAFCPLSIAVFEFQDEVTVTYRENGGDLQKTLEVLMQHGSYALSNKLLARFGKLLPPEFKDRFKQEGTTNDTQIGGNEE